jgi:uncharacterized protein (TIGR03437 family)
VVIRTLLVMLSLLASPLALAGSDTPRTGYTIQTVAGSDSVGDGGPSLAALLSQTEGVAVDSSGAVYVADAWDNRVRKITPDGLIQTVAGTGVAGFSGDGGAANAAQLSQPYGIAVDFAGNLYIADLGNARVRKLTPDGNIQTVAGGGSIVPGGNGDGGSAVAAQLVEPRNVAVEADGTLFVSDFGANRVYQISPRGTLTTLAGNGNSGFSGDGAAAQLAQLNAPAGLAVDSSGSVFIADSGNSRIRKVYQGVIGTVDSILSPTGLAIGPSGALYVAAASYAGTLTQAFGGVPSATDITVDQQGNAYVTTGPVVLKITGAGAVSTIAGSGASIYFGGDGGAATSARLYAPAGIAVDSVGNWYIADTGNNRIRKITPGGIIDTIAGTGVPGSQGDNGFAVVAQLNGPRGVAVDSQLNIYVADTGNNEIRKITPAGTITTLSAQFNDPEYVAVGPDGTLYIADAGDNRVVELTPNGTSSILTQVLGPTAVMLDSSGNLYISGQTEILELSPAGTITTVQGGLTTPGGLALASDGSLLIAEKGTNVILSLGSAGALSTIAGTGVAGFSGDGGRATAAQLNTPSDLAIDSSGGILIVDSTNNRIRRLTPPTVVPPSTPSAAGVTVVNAASMLPGSVAPGEIITIFGSGFVANQTQLLFDGNATTISYSGTSQINALTPVTLTPNSNTEISIVVNGAKVADFNSSVAAAIPGIFTTGNGTGPAAVNNQDGTVNSAANPAARGSIVSLYATGGGVGVSAVGLTIGGYTAQLLYAGPAPGLPGLMQINAEVPAGFLAPGIQPVVLTVGTVASQSGVTIALY